MGRLVRAVALLLPSECAGFDGVPTLPATAGALICNQDLSLLTSTIVVPLDFHRDVELRAGTSAASTKPHRDRVPLVAHPDGGRLPQVKSSGVVYG